MPELRKDYVTDTWVVFSPARAKRPGDFALRSSPTPLEECPFCNGHESRTPPEILALRPEGPPDSPGWTVRCFPNQYPALEPKGDLEEDGSAFFRRVSGVGSHEIIVESPRHDGHLQDLSAAEMGGVLDVYLRRYRELDRDPRFRYVMIFKNHGERAGASISHPHSQLLAMPIVPRRVTEEIDGMRAARRTGDGTCAYCVVLEREGQEGRRVVAENESFLALSPFAARFSFETWILPKAHETSFEGMDWEEQRDLARIVKDVLGRLHRVLDDPPFNYYIHTAPLDQEEIDYHWHWEITPRLTEVAGFERGTDFYINPVTPEDAAAILRGEINGKS